MICYLRNALLVKGQDGGKNYKLETVDSEESPNPIRDKGPEIPTQSVFLKPDAIANYFKTEFEIRNYFFVNEVVSRVSHERSYLVRWQD